MLDEPVHLSPHNPEWEATFRQEKDRILALLPSAGGIEHIGSTAVPGLAAKPVVDIMVGLTTVPPTTNAAERLLGIGYEPLGTAGVAGRWYFRKRVGLMCNLHVVLVAGRLWEDNLDVRDYLRSSDDARRRYEAAKHGAIASGNTTLLAYSQAKAAMVRDLVAEARLWRAGL